jgi:hypothetical protein
VERSDTHQLRACEDDGFREGLNPSCALQSERGHGVERENVSAARTVLWAQ